MKTVHEQAVQKQEARLMRAYHELERLDGEHGGHVIMPYDVVEPLKLQLLEQLGMLD